MVLEDLQWVDASTMELAKLLVEGDRTAPLMQIYTARAGFDLLWPARKHHIYISLGSLPDHEAWKIVEALGSDQGLPRKP